MKERETETWKTQEIVRDREELMRFSMFKFSLRKRRARKQCRHNFKAAMAANTK